MSRFCSCDGINASRNVSKSDFVSAGGGLGCGATAETFIGGGEGSDISGDGAGPCPCAVAKTTAAMMEADKTRIGCCIGGGGCPLSCCRQDRGVSRRPPSNPRPDEF